MIVYNFEPERSLLFDFYRAASSGYSDDLLCINKSEDADIILEADSKIIDAFNVIWEGIDKNSTGLKIFLARNYDGKCFLTEHYENLNPDIIEFDKLKNKIIGSNYFNTFKKMYRFYSSNKNMEDIECINPGDINKVFDMVSDLKIADDIKWELLIFFRNPEPVLRNIVEIFELIYKRIILIYEINGTWIRNFENEIRQKFNNQGDELFIFKENPQLASMLSKDVLSSHNEVTVFYSFFLDYNIRAYSRKAKNIFICLGINYIKLSNRLKIIANWDNAYNFIKALSDKTRQNIYKQIVRLKETNPKEIGEILNLAPSTMTHHMVLLDSGNILDMKRIGKCTYYKANAQKIEMAIKNLRECLLEDIADEEKA